MNELRKARESADDAAKEAAQCRRKLERCIGTAEGAMIKAVLREALDCAGRAERAAEAAVDHIRHAGRIARR